MKKSFRPITKLWFTVISGRLPAGNLLIFPQTVVGAGYTPNANMADHSDGPELVAWKRGQSVCDLVCFDYASCVVL